ncbi:MAG: 23S rRNA (guanosine(2251)-2'-O)-methyltransferase RlmB [Acidobacteria bacterium]|nr:23S rRNA (guanosine(2251)-2'-O)-methyltransferase RlmB [Acidobacteriota bacterium]
MRFLGPNACREALERGQVQTLRIAPQAWGRTAELRAAARERGVTVHQEPMESLDRRAAGQRHQGVLGEGEEVRLLPFEAFEQRTFSPRFLGLALDGITDPHNFGAILRSAAAAGVDGVIFPERRSAQVNETVMRASAGTAGRVPLVRVVNLGRALDEMKDLGVRLLGLDAGPEAANYLEEDFQGPCMLVLGSEGEGLHAKIRERCDRLLRIPMPGGTESLNVSAAAAVILFRALARRA